MLKKPDPKIQEVKGFVPQTGKLDSILEAQERIFTTHKPNLDDSKIFDDLLMADEKSSIGASFYELNQESFDMK